MSRSKARAHTGDVSALNNWPMPAPAAVIIVGHSERRHDHGESDEMVQAPRPLPRFSAPVWISMHLRRRDPGRARGKKSGGTMCRARSSAHWQHCPTPATADNTVVRLRACMGDRHRARRQSMQDVARTHARSDEAAHSARLSVFDWRADMPHCLWRLGQARQCQQLSSALDDVDGALWFGGASLKAVEFLADHCHICMNGSDLRQRAGVAFRAAAFRLAVGPSVFEFPHSP